LAAVAPIPTAALAGTPQSDDLAPIRSLRDFRFGSDRSILDRVAASVREAMASEVRRKAVASALAEIAVSDAPFDARQFACRQLVRVASPAQIPAMARLLRDGPMAHYGLMVLARIPGPGVADAVRSALAEVKGGALLGAMDLLGERRDATAVALLSQRLGSGDDAVAACAADALAKIGGSQADAALLREFAHAGRARKAALADALLRRGEIARASGLRATAGRLYAAVAESAVPEPTRAGAFRGVCLLDGKSGVVRVIAALSGRPGPMCRMAASLARTLPGKGVTKALVAALRRLRPDRRVLLLAALADRGDASAVPAVARCLSDADAAVRAQAIATMGVLGGATAVGPLVAAASARPPAERALAATALTRLRGTGVEAALARAMRSSKGGVRAAAIRAVTARQVAVPLPAIVNAACSDSGAPRKAALDALRDLGRAADLAPLLDLMLRLKPGSRDAVIATVVAIGRRTGGEGAAGDARARLTRARAVGDRVALLEVIGQIGGSEALEALRCAARDPDDEVRLAAVRALSEWPDAGPKQLLLDLVRKSAPGRLRSVAMRGYLRMLPMPGAGVSLASAGDIFAEALDLARTVDERRLVLSGMAAIGSERCLRLVTPLRADPDLRSEAEVAAMAIAYQTAGAWPEVTRTALAALKAEAGDAPTRAKAAALLDTMARFGDFAMAWEVSPAYAREGLDCLRLFDAPFAPEDPEREENAGWRALPVGAAPDQPWLLDLLAMHGGEQKVTYIRTQVWSASECDLIAEIGTDDGLKVWWNGALVHANNTQRAVAPAQEKVPVHARAGWNRMLIKVTQNVMGWGACVRFTDTGGSPAAGLRFMLPSALSGKDPL